MPQTNPGNPVRFLSKFTANYYYLCVAAFGYLPNSKTDYAGGCPNQSRQSSPLFVKIYCPLLFTCRRVLLSAKLEVRSCGRLPELIHQPLPQFFKIYGQSIFYVVARITLSFLSLVIIQILPKCRLAITFKYRKKCFWRHFGKGMLSAVELSTYVSCSIMRWCFRSPIKFFQSFFSKNS